MAGQQAIAAMRARKREAFDVFREAADRLWGWLAENRKGLLDQTCGAAPTTRQTAP